jgi:glutamate-1-semialdehyde 2,1-aminomutase
LRDKPTSPPVAYLPSAYREVREHDRDLYRRELAGFVPPDALDAHAHLYTVAGLNLDVDGSDEDAAARQGFDAYRQSLSSWMGDDCPRDGLFFALPANGRVDVERENAFVAAQVAARRRSRALRLIRPGDDPAIVESELRAGRFAGFKAYHLFARSADTYEAAIGEFLPDWAWELAEAHGLAIMLHLVRRRALSDPENQHYLRARCGRHRRARLILAHAARGFCARHTIDGIGSLGGQENVYFDTSAICEPGAIEAVLRAFGPSRLAFGTDWPVCNLRGRCVSVGDGFFWMHEHNVDFAGARFCRPTLVGIESLLALRQAVRACRLRDGDVERIFRGTAEELFT